MATTFLCGCSGTLRASFFSLHLFYLPLQNFSSRLLSIAFLFFLLGSRRLGARRRAAPGFARAASIMSWYNEEAYESLRRRGYTSFNGNYGYLMYGDYDPRDHGHYNRSGEHWDDSFMGDGSFYMAAGSERCRHPTRSPLAACTRLRNVPPFVAPLRRVCSLTHTSRTQVWVCFTVLLLVQGAWAFLRSHAVEKRRVSEIFHLITSSRRAYEKPKAAAASTATAEDAPTRDDAVAGDDVEGPTTSPHEAVGTTNGKQPAGDCMVGSIEENMNECPLCLEDYEDGDQVSKLPCGHRYACDCTSA